MGVRADAYQLRYTAGRFAAGAQELRRKASQVQGTAQGVVQGPRGWTGEASQTFRMAGEGIHHRLSLASDALEQVAGIFQTLAAKVEHIESLRREADSLESYAWSLPDETPEEQARVSRKMRRASELRHQADMEAQIADQQAAAAFGQVSVPSGPVFGSESHRGPYNDADVEGIPDKWRRKYLQNRDFFEDPDTTTYNKLTPGAYKREDYDSSAAYQDKRETLMAKLKEIIQRQEVAGYITEKDQVQEIVHELYGKYYGDFTLEELETAIQQRSASEELEAEIQAKRLAGEDITQDPRYYQYASSQLMGPTPVESDAMGSMMSGGFLVKKNSGVANGFKKTSEDAHGDVEHPEGRSRNQNETSLDDHIGTMKVTDVEEKTATETNAWWKEEMGYENPPYTPDTKVLTFRLEDDTQFVRVYDGENSGMYGGWMMRETDIKGLTPAQIQDKFALPTIPKFVVDVKLKAGTVIRCGEANPLPGWGRGGGTQFDLRGQRVGDFVNPRELSEGN